MSMPLPIAVKDGWYHVMARAPSRRSLFDDERAHEHFGEYAGLHGNERRDLALYLAGRVCGLTLREMGGAGIEHDKTVGQAVVRFGRLAEWEPARASWGKRAMREMSKVEI